MGAFAGSLASLRNTSLLFGVTMQTLAAKTSAPRAARATTVRVQASLKPIHTVLKSAGVAAASLALAGSAFAADVKLGADNGA